jgi:hypothetical protein
VWTYLRVSRSFLMPPSNTGLLLDPSNRLRLQIQKPTQHWNFIIVTLLSSWFLFFQERHHVGTLFQQTLLLNIINFISISVIIIILIFIV